MRGLKSDSVFIDEVKDISQEAEPRKIIKLPRDHRLTSNCKCSHCKELYAFEK